MKIIFAFRTRLSFLSKEKTLYTICYAVVNLLSRTTQSYLRQQPLSLRAFCASLGTLGSAFRSASSRAASSIYFFQKKKLFILFAMQLSIFFLALLRILTYGNSRVLPALFRFARDSGSLLAFLPSLSPLPTYFFNKSLVGSNGLGPSTSRLSGVCSNQMSYEPVLVEVIGFEPMTPCLQGRCSTN